MQPADWAVIGFYLRVRDQYINQAPMGVTKGPLPLHPRIESYRAALELFGYPVDTWAWLTDGALLLHRLCNDLERINWYVECGKTLEHVTVDDVT